MPLYEFSCSCGNEQEEIVLLNTSSIICKKCGLNMKRVMSLSSFHLKGSGWAADCYGKSKGLKEKNK